jgi:16S rRNA (guanine527-N7)-methyltransferase
MSSPTHFPAGLDPALAARLETWLALLLKWNARINLTADREPDVIVHRHVAECLFAAEHIPVNTGTLLDVGSGAGLPGIMIALARPHLAVTLAESQRNKAAFLREAVRALELQAEVWDGRVQDLPPERLFDAITLRAVDKMAEACRGAVPHVARGGLLLVFATPKTDAALEALSDVAWDGPIPIPGANEAFLKPGSPV